MFILRAFIRNTDVLVDEVACFWLAPAVTGQWLGPSGTLVEGVTVPGLA